MRRFSFSCMRSLFDLWYTSPRLTAFAIFLSRPMLTCSVYRWTTVVDVTVGN